jgi:hypothetical protein
MFIEFDSGQPNKKKKLVVIMIPEGMQFGTIYIKYKVTNYIPCTGGVFNGQINNPAMPEPKFIPRSHKPAIVQHIKLTGGRPRPLF